LLYLLRHPIARIESMYEHMVLTGRERRPIDQAVTEDARYLGPSLYGLNLSTYMDRFPSEQILILFTDEVATELDQVLGRVRAFLRLPQPFVVNDVRRDLVSEERRTDRRVKSALRNYSRVHQLYLAAPQVVRTRLNRVATRDEVRSRPRLSAQTAAQLMPRLLADLELLQTLVGDQQIPWANGLHSSLEHRERSQT
jgi:hypothetical protein